VGHDRREFSFWRAVGRLRVSQLVRVETAAALALGGGGGVAAALLMTRTDRLATAGDFQALSGALVGVVFAGFTLVVGLMSDRYALWLVNGRDGVIDFLSPFLVSVGIQVTSLIADVVYRAAGSVIPSPCEKSLFGSVAIIFLYAALDVVALARSVLAHGVTRAEAAEIEALERQVDEQSRRRDESVALLSATSGCRVDSRGPSLSLTDGDRQFVRG
jgi:hypothetical protein